jgi:pimeloyl-ACP methyl ester carboxylesterase
LDGLKRLLLAAALCWGLPASVKADEFVELKIPLEEGRYVSLRGYCSECNRLLGTHYDLDSVGDHRIELTPAKRRVLLALAFAPTDKLRVRATATHVIVKIPNREDQQVRRRYRRLIGKTLGIDLDEWPQAKGLHLPTPFDPAARSILLIHGLESDADTWTGMTRAFRRHGIQVLTFDYPNDGPISWSGDRLSEELSALCRKYPDFRLVIVAHSMGGLVTRYALETPGKNLGCVTDLFTLGTPHAGSVLAGGQKWLELAFEGVPNKKTDWKTLRDGTGEASVDLRPGNTFLKELNGQHRPDGVRYHCAIGTRGFITDELYDTLLPQLDEVLQKRGFPAVARAWLEGLLKQSDAFRTGTATESWPSRARDSRTRHRSDCSSSITCSS